MDMNTTYMDQEVGAGQKIYRISDQDKVVLKKYLNGSLFTLLEGALNKA